MPYLQEDDRVKGNVSDAATEKITEFYHFNAN